MSFAIFELRRSSACREVMKSNVAWLESQLWTLETGGQLAPEEPEEQPPGVRRTGTGQFGRVYETAEARRAASREAKRRWREKEKTKRAKRETSKSSEEGAHQDR